LAIELIAGYDSGEEYNENVVDGRGVGEALQTIQHIAYSREYSSSE
jgi:hypothetical protein